MLIRQYDATPQPVKRRKLDSILNDRLRKDQDSLKSDTENPHNASPSTSKHGLISLFTSPEHIDSLVMSMQKADAHHRLTHCDAYPHAEESMMRKIIRNKGMQHYLLLKSMVDEWYYRRPDNYCFHEIYSSGLLGHAYTRFWRLALENKDTMQTYYEQHFFSFLEILKRLPIERKSVFVRYAFQQRAPWSIDNVNTQESSGLRMLNEELTTTFNQITSSDTAVAHSIDECFIDTLLDYSFFSPRLLFSKLLRVVIKNKGYTKLVSSIFRSLQGLAELRASPKDPSLLVAEIQTILQESEASQLTENEQRNAISFLIEALEVGACNQQSAILCLILGTIRPTHQAAY
ncbi:hypothetical protein K493DRAFT_42176 [Basidiobolus meristosporus CBS 931.73]|uniref:Edg1 TPR repeats region domain-containing protein n=1 Tax=Basidiobolus meristosporus CBS 931.73 TaxID=1314790 RepID=A0A1Y1Y3K8_9FUNG|nr:hypothetical protein K493DRAFT_42176 [Basidiobolus meristosporus CBS 931.73]|eukprot:ORX92578.1 hypothetical protein K493DRAFT_42176 [Basidiobolus meristosporus CBS 931.73]